MEGNNNFNVANIPEEYKPISAWGYFGYQLLFAIPCVGIILLIIFSCGGTRNINLRNFARSYFCVLLLLVILFAIIMFIATILGISVFSIKNSNVFNF